MSQLYRISSDTNSSELERLTYFNIDSGRTIRSFVPLLGEDWRGAWRTGGALMVMDLTGNENFQLWCVYSVTSTFFFFEQTHVYRRYWEDTDSEATFPKIDGELDNRPGRGRFERVTNDNFTYHSVTISHSNRFAALLFIPICDPPSCTVYRQVVGICFHKGERQGHPGLLHQANRLEHGSNR